MFAFLFFLLAAPCLVKGGEICDAPEAGVMQSCTVTEDDDTRVANKLGTCDLDTATACGAKFTGKSGSVKESRNFSFLDAIALCESAGLTGKLLVKCLENSIKAKTFVEYASKLGLLKLLF